MGLTDYSYSEILADLPSQINIYRSHYAGLVMEHQTARQQVARLAREESLALVKLLYLEALNDGFHIERARGRAETKLGFPPEEIEDDEELQIICALFEGQDI